MKVTVSQIQRRRAQQAGFTLIELLVVLVVLIALAGIIIPQLPNMLVRAHAASGATSIKETNKAIQHFEQLYFKGPSGFDNLAVSATALAEYLPGAPTGGASAAGTFIEPGALVADEVTALTAAGITEVAPLHPTTSAFGTGQSPTYDPYSGANVATPLFAAIVDEAKVEAKVRADVGTGDRYVIFGVGQRSEMLGKSMSEAGADFIDGPTGNAGDSYHRFGAIFKIANADALNNVTILEKAVFVGTVAIHDDDLITPGDESAEFYTAIQD